MTGKREPSKKTEPVYPKKWAYDVLLADGGTVHFRPVSANDGTAIAAMHGRLSRESIYSRYFSARRMLSEQQLHRFTHVDYRDRMAFVATLRDDVIAFASYDRVADSDEYEVAFTVEDAHQGRGLGTLLLEHLAAVARENGILRFVADILYMNRPMLRVFREAGYRIDRNVDGGVVHMSFAIRPTRASRAREKRRERSAEARSVERLLSPRSIAVIGAGRRPGNIGHEILHNLLDGGFTGVVHPIHPSAQEILGQPAFKTVIDVDGPVDLAIIAVPPGQVLDVVDQCAEHRVGGLMVVTAGFAETGSDGALVEREIVRRARGSGMRVVGPNCLGMVNTAPHVRMNATFARVAASPGRVGFLSQSGAIAIAVLEGAARLELGISSFASVGNKADVSGNDFLEYWAEDPHTDVILLYLESFGNPRKFSRVARQVSRRKPIIAVKAGRSRAGSLAASSHTAALASPDVAVDELFRQAGVIRVDSLEELFDVAQVVSNQPLPAGVRVAVVGNSGGPGIMAADACETAGLVLPELSPTTQAALREFLPPGAALRNPVDLVASASGADYERALRIVLQDAGIDALVAIFTPTLATPAEPVMDAIATVAAQEKSKPVLANLIGLPGMPATLRVGAAVAKKGNGSASRTRRGSRVPVFRYPESAARALARVAVYAEWRSRPAGHVPRLRGVRAAKARRIVDTAMTARPDGGWLDPAAAFELLAAYGIAIPATTFAPTAEAATRAARGIEGPFVLKAGSGRIVHKTDVGAVVLDLATPESVGDAFDEMHARLGDEMGGAIVQPMVTAGFEAIVGIAEEGSFGQLLVFGAGGRTAELMNDRVVHSLPLTKEDAREMVHSLRSSPLLFGYRGAPALDVEGLEDVLLRVALLAEQLPEVVEMDVNPVIVGAEHVSAVDVAVRLAPWEPHPELAVRRLR